MKNRTNEKKRDHNNHVKDYETAHPGVRLRNKFLLRKEV